MLSVPVTKYASFSQQAGTLKTNLLDLISNFSKYYFKTGTIFPRVLSSHTFTTLEFDSNHLGTLLWKVVKPCEHNEIEPPIGKLLRKYKPLRSYFVMNQKHAHIKAKSSTTITEYPTSEKNEKCYNLKVYDNYDKVSYLQRIKNANLKTTFQKKVSFSQ